MTDVHVDFSGVYRAIDRVQSDIYTVSNQVAAVQSQAVDTRTRLEAFYDEFREFVLKDIKSKEIQRADTRLIQVRQDLDKQFGHHDEARRHAVGILQAMDAGVVRGSTMLTSAEGLMTNCPRYWLAPALIALVAWIRDDRVLAEEALRQAMTRDDNKTALMFALICRRAGRHDAGGQWLDRYFQNQDPFKLDREVVLMLDAAVNGVFGGSALEVCLTMVDSWLAELENQAGFIDNERARWVKTLTPMAPAINDNPYPHLKANSATWPEIEISLSATRRNQVVKDFFNALFSTELAAEPNLAALVDSRLDTLVTRYDDAELSLLQEERRLQLIVEEDGDLDRAGARLDVEADAYRASTDFATTLTMAAMFPKNVGVSLATQRYAITLSRDWIRAGYNDLVAADRAALPQKIALSAGSWSSETIDASNETDLTADLDHHYKDRIAKALKDVRVGIGTWVFVGLAVLVMLMVFGQNAVFGLLVALGIGGFVYYQHTNVGKRRTRIRDALETEARTAGDILRACLAEVVDLRRELSVEDAKAGEVLSFLNALEAASVLRRRPGAARNVIA
jgi:hypothetical protein